MKALSPKVLSCVSSVKLCVQRDSESQGIINTGRMKVTISISLSYVVFWNLYNDKVSSPFFFIHFIFLIYRSSRVQNISIASSVPSKYVPGVCLIVFLYCLQLSVIYGGFVFFVHLPVPFVLGWGAERDKVLCCLVWVCVAVFYWCYWGETNIKKDRGERQRERERGRETEHILQPKWAKT